MSSENFHARGPSGTFVVTVWFRIYATLPLLIVIASHNQQIALASDSLE